MKKSLSFLVTVILSIQFFLPVPFSEAAVSLTALSALLIEPWSEKIIYSRDPHRKGPPASTAKLVTALVVLDLLSLEQWVTMTGVLKV
jgi:D-alanyl-D-alanine carboxypeptidase (penicillin-binding protein 5/6)